MKKWLTVVLILALSLLTAGCGKGGGRWVLVDTKFNEKEWYAELAEYNKSMGDAYPCEAQVSEGSFIWVRSYIGKDVSDKRSYAFPGNSFTTQGGWASPSEIVRGPKFEVSMRLKIKAVDWHPEHPMQPGCCIRAEVPIPQADGKIYHSRLHAYDGVHRLYSDAENDYEPVDFIVTGKMGKGETTGERRALEVWVGQNYPPLMSYIYEWQK